MNHSLEAAVNGFGLMANGSSQNWSVCIDESIKGPERWFVELDGPAVCLSFQLLDVRIIHQIIAFLESHDMVETQGQKAMYDQCANELNIGLFGRSPVSLIWDDEFHDRCFLIVGPRSKSSMRLTLQGEDVPMLLEALRQVRGDLSLG